MKTVICLILFLFFVPLLNAQNEPLVGIVDDQIVEINELTGQATAVQTITNRPSIHTLTSLTWVRESRTYWGVYYDGTNWGIFKITEGGVYSDKGSLSVNMNTAFIIEGIAYNRAQQKLFVSASLNGGGAQSDWYSESLVELDTNTITGTLVNTISHPMYLNFYESEADAFTFTDNDMLYYSDPHHNHHTRFYKTDASNQITPTLIFDDTYNPIGEMAFKNGKVFYTFDKKLYQFDTQNNDTHSLVGTMYSGAQFNGEDLRCITWKDTLEREDLSVSEIEKGIELKIYPNPSGNHFQIDLIGSSLNDANMNVKIYSVNGKIVSEFVYKKGEKIICNSWNEGVYLIHIVTSKGTIVKRFVKE